MKLLLGFLVRSNLWISLGAGLWAYAITSGMGTPLTDYALFVGFATLAVYNYQRIVKQRKGIYSGQNHDFGRSYVQYVGLAVGAIGSSLFAFSALKDHWLYLLPFVGLAAFYVVPKALPINRGLRSVPAIKVYLIALSWAGLLGFLPSVLLEQSVSIIVSQSAYVFCFVLGITIPFDIRDLKHDPPSLKTLPQMLGVRNAKILSGILLLLALSLSFLLQSQMVQGVVQAQVCASLLCFPLLYVCSEKSESALYGLGFDGSILLLALVQLILIVGNV